MFVEWEYPFYWRKALSCYLVFWIPSPCLGTGFSGSVFCLCFEFSVYICVYLVVLRMCFFLFGVFIYVFFVVGALMGVEWIEEGFMIFCVLFFFCFIFFEMMREWVVIIVYEQVCFDFFCIYFCFVKGFPCLEYLFRKCPSDVVHVGKS